MYKIAFILSWFIVLTLNLNAKARSSSTTPKGEAARASNNILSAQRTGYSLDELKKILSSQEAAKTIAISTVGMGIGTWTVLSMNGFVFLLTAGHVTLPSFGEFRGVENLPQLSTPIDTHGKYFTFNAQFFIGQQEGNKPTRLLTHIIASPQSSRDLDQALHNDYGIALLLPNTVPEKSITEFKEKGLTYFDLNVTQLIHSKQIQRIIDQQSLFPIKFSKSVKIGDSVVLPGFPKNVGQSISTGIVVKPETVEFDASDKQFPYDEDSEFLVNTLVTEGNSGGPVFDLQGRLLGIAVRGNGPQDASLGKAEPYHYARVIRIEKIIKNILSHLEPLRSLESSVGAKQMTITADQVGKALKSRLEQ